MAVSLTREEFLERLEERKGLYGLAIAYDFEKVNTNELINTWIESNNLHVQVTPLIGELIRQAITRVIDLVYQEL